MQRILDMAEGGASIGTIEAAIGLPKGRLRIWLHKGEEKPKSAYRRLYNLYRQAAAQAKFDAESNQLAKAPSQWLERNTSAKLLDSKEDISNDTPTNVPPQEFIKVGANQAMNLLRIMRASGTSIDELLDTNSISALEDKSDESS